MVANSVVGFTAVLSVLLLATSAEILISSLNQLPLDENNRLATNVLLHPDTDACREKLSSVHLDEREIFAISSDLSGDVFGPSYSNCAAVCLEKGIPTEGLLHPLPQHINKDGSNLHRWIISNCQKVEVGFISYNEHDAITYWIDGTGQRKQVNTLQYGERKTQWHTTTLGHRFQVVDSKSGELLRDHLVSYNGIVLVGGQPPSMIQQRDVSRQVESTFVDEWRKSHKIKRTFTEFGFDKGRLPPDLFTSMSAYYYNNQNERVREEWSGKGLFVNWWERDVYMVSMPFKLKDMWQNRLRELVEAWAGVDMEYTSIYGMRRYEEGARLLTHVDREQTHAASLIINIAQSNVRHPWKVEIYDFAYRLHEIEMQPGDIVYYESAKCLHGRMRPLDGDYYVNLFAHYRPKETGATWFLEPNPPDTPVPMMEPIGAACNSQPSATSVDEQQQQLDLTAVGEDCLARTKSIAPYMDPTRNPLYGPVDLFNYWKEVEPVDPAVPSSAYTRNNKPGNTIVDAKHSSNDEL